jgi:hypothetical protein
MPFGTVLVEVVGWAGAVVLLAAYALLSAGRLHQASATYQWMNLAGAVGLMANQAFYGSWPPIAVNLVWSAIAVASLVRRPATRS